MRHKALYPGILVLAVLALSSLFVIGSRLGTKAQSMTECCATNPVTAPRELDFPYYSLRDGFKSTLNLVSNSPASLDFIIAMHSLSGQTLLSNNISIDPGAKMPVDLASLITSLGDDPTGPFGEGSISVYFTGTIMPLVGQLTMTNPALKLVHESEMVENDPGRSDIPAVLSGLWWGLSGGRDARIMVANVSANAVTADVFLYFQGQRHPSVPLLFNPNETKVLSVAQMLGDLGTSPSQAPEGGITIIQRGANPSLIAQGKVTDPVTGFSSTLEFPDPARQAASALHAVGLPIGTPPAGSPYAGTGSFTPHVIARNLSDQPQFLTVTVEYPQSAAWNSTNWPGGPPKPMVRYAGLLQQDQKNPNDAFNHANTDPSALTGQLTLPPLAVSAYGTVDFSLAAVMNQLPQPLAYCSIRIQYSGAPGTMIAQASSVDASQDLVVDAPMANEADGWAGSGANPWHLDANTESILFLTDESDQPARIGFSVTGNGVRYYLTSLQLAPHETRAIDLRQLRDAQIADLQNSRIPAVSTDGSVTWVRMDNVPVAGRLVVISRSGGIASNYDCQTCNCPITLSSVGITPGTCTMVPGGSMQCTAMANYQNCNGYPFPSDVTDSSTWSSNNTPVSTVNSTGLETIQGGGTSTITASYRGATSYTYNCLKGCTCIEHDNPKSGSHGTSGTMLSCGPVTRGQTATCSVSNIPAGATFSNWKFTDGTNSVTTTSTTSSWSGTAVKSGTVSVQVTSGGKSPTLPAPLTVNARSGWAFTAVSAVKESNGAGTGACTGQLPLLGSPPTATSGDIGKSCLANEWSYQFTQVSDLGPNNGYWYTTSASSTNTKTGLAAAYQWERVPDLDNTSSTFYQHQTGTYNASTDPSGCISGSNLATQTQRHEIGLASSNYIESHWVEYQTALNNSANNFGTIIEATMGPPSESQSGFSGGLDTALSNTNNNILNAFRQDPYGADHSEYDLFLGFINYAPNYSTCQ